MGRVISYGHRQKIVRRRQRGDQYSQIAKAYNVSESGVRKIWYAYKKYGKSALLPNYSKCGRPSPYGATIRDQVNDIRDNKQGGVYVSAKFRQRYPQSSVPSARTLQRWWKALGESNPKGRPRRKTEKKME